MKFKPWRTHVNFVNLHYAWIIFMSILSLVVMCPAGNLEVVDAFFFGTSASTESGLNTVDLKALYTYQQLYCYFAPIFTNLGFINAVAALVRFLWFRQHLARVAPRLHAASQDLGNVDLEASGPDQDDDNDKSAGNGAQTPTETETEPKVDSHPGGLQIKQPEKTRTIMFDPSTDQHPKNNETLYIPGPRERERGIPIVASIKPGNDSQEDLSITIATQSGPSAASNSSGLRRRNVNGLALSSTKTMDRVASVASSLFVMGGGQESPTKRRASLTSSASRQQQQQQQQVRETLSLSRTATVGRNSSFRGLTKEDFEKLGGLEYRSLKLLLKIVFPYFFGLHLLGALCLVGWIQRADPKYKEVLREARQGKTWWAFYSAQTMVDNLGFTLTPNSMISFNDAEWPMFLMSFLAFAGNTLYPVFLRLIIWTMSKLTPRKSSLQEPLSFLLNHPRRCYTLLFPSRPTLVLFSIIFLLNFIDTILIIVLDLHNPELTSLPIGPRILAAIFQAASTRHTGTAAFNLANVSPAVQFSLLVMMYIAIFPIAISIRASNTYEERSLGIYEKESNLDESKATGYFLSHVRNQLSFDMWFIFLGVFCICIAEADRIKDNSIPYFTVWTVFFEVTSAYGNVGLSLGYPDGNTSLSGVFTTFSKLVICAIMIRGRHRGLPYAIDRAIMLPDECDLRDETETESHDERE